MFLCVPATDRTSFPPTRDLYRRSRSSLGDYLKEAFREAIFTLLLLTRFPSHLLLFSQRVIGFDSLIPRLASTHILFHPPSSLF